MDVNDTRARNIIFIGECMAWRERYRSSIPTLDDILQITVGVCNIKGAIQYVMITIFSDNQVEIAVKHAKQCMLSFVGFSKTVIVLLVEG